MVGVFGRGLGWGVISASSQSHRLTNHTSSSLVSLGHSIPAHRTCPECEYGAITTIATDVLKIMCLVVFAECFDVFVTRIVTTEEHAVAQLVKHCATSRKFAGSIPDGVTAIFHCHNPSCRTTTLGSTQT